MALYYVDVSIRKGEGPEWIQKKFEVVLEDFDFEVPEEELTQWVKDEVRRKLKTSEAYKSSGDNWIITDVTRVSSANLN